MLVTALAPRAGERWLDVGTGSGGVALIAARGGARVVGVDIAENAVAAARAAASDEGADARFEVAGAEALPFAVASFEVVSSAFGVIFARSHERAAGELARVCAPDGRLGLTLMPPGSRAADLWSLIRRYGADDGDHPAAWAEPGRPAELLAPWFDVEVSEHETAPQEEDDPQRAWTEMAVSFGPLKVLVARLDATDVEALRAEFVALRRRHAGRPLRYVLVLGRRR